jgi:hypothetical protein
VSSKKEKWDGRSRPTNNIYEKRWEEIFGQKEIKELDESLKQSKANRKERELDKETQDYVDSLKDKL